MNSKAIERLAYALMIGTLLIHAFLFWKDRLLIAKGYPDFTIFYTAGSMVRQGLGHQLYDDSVQYRMQRSFASGVVTRQGNLPYNHPPFEALVFAPLSWLPYLPAYVVWNLLNVAMIAGAPLLLRPHIAVLRQGPLILWMFALLAFTPVFSTLQQGHDAILLLFLEILAFVALKRNSDVPAGCWLGLASFKFHLVLPLALIVGLGWKRTKTLLAFLLTCLVLGAVSVAIVGWKEALLYPGYVLHRERSMVHDAILPDLMPNLRGLLVGWRLSPRTGSILEGIALALSLSLLFWVIVFSRKYVRQKIDLPFTLATVVALLISYHTFAYDLVLLAAPLFAVLDLIVLKDFDWRREPFFLVPAGILLLAPVYILLTIRLVHLNLVAVVLLFWLWGIQNRMRAPAPQKDQI